MTRCAQPPSLPGSQPRLVLQPPTSTSYLIAFQTIPSRGVLFCIVLIVAFQLFHHCHFGISVTHELTKRSLKKKHTAIRDFPGGPVVQNLPCNAGNVGSIPGWGTKIPHVVGATEPMCLNYRTCMLQQKIPLVTTKTQCSQINRQKSLLKKPLQLVRFVYSYLLWLISTVVSLDDTLGSTSSLSGG